MELFTPHGWSSFILDCIRDGYLFVTIICLFLRVLRRRNISRFAVNVQFAANLLLAFGVLLDILVWGQFYYEAYIDGEAVFGTPEAYQYYSIVVACTILYWVLGLLFFIRRFRLSWLLSLLVLLLMNAHYIIPLLLSSSRHRLDDDWSTNRIEIMIQGIVIFSILTALVYFIYYKRKKLPYN
jgi:hypothetical protein